MFFDERNDALTIATRPLWNGYLSLKSEHNLSAIEAVAENFFTEPRHKSEAEVAEAIEKKPYRSIWIFHQLSYHSAESLESLFKLLHLIDEGVHRGRVNLIIPFLVFPRWLDAARRVKEQFHFEYSEEFSEALLLRILLKNERATIYSIDMSEGFPNNEFSGRLVDVSSSEVLVKRIRNLGLHFDSLLPWDPGDLVIVNRISAQLGLPVIRADELDSTKRTETSILICHRCVTDVEKFQRNISELMIDNCSVFCSHFDISEEQTQLLPSLRCRRIFTTNSVYRGQNEKSELVDILPMETMIAGVV